MIENFDVVDEQDRPTGELTTKQVAETQNILHRCVAVFVFDKTGKLYVQSHRSGLLDHSVGGHVSAGETYLTAAIREAEEELGLKDEKLEEICTGLYSDENFYGIESSHGVRLQHMFGIYVCYPSDSWQFVPNDEVEHITPVEIVDIVQQMNETPGKFTPGFINTMAKYLEAKSLPYALDVKNSRQNWGKTR